MGIGAVVVALLWSAGARAQGVTYRREQIAVACLSWLLAGVLGALPFQGSGLLPNGIDAVFESVSGLATCGGTILGSAGVPPPEATPHSLLLWRALLHWFGGIGIVLLFATLRGADGGSRHLFELESASITTDADQARASVQARSVLFVYVALTAACVACLLLVGMDLFEAVCHA